MNILFLTKYDRRGASSRLRTLQYLPLFQAAGIKATVSPLFEDSYLTTLYEGGRRQWPDIMRSLARRFRGLLDARKFDLVVVEYEIMPYLPAFAERLLEFLRVPYVVDYDDAVFHRYDCHDSKVLRRILGSKIASVMRRASCVISGNSYIADYAVNAGARNVEIVPTVVDLRKYTRTDYRRPADGIFTIGWIGSPTSGKYLKDISSVLSDICADGRTQVCIIGADKHAQKSVSAKFLPWDESTEVEMLYRLDVGIMPLSDSPWERGKCGFKLIQYMACGLPVVASPVGMNADIVQDGVNGFLVDSLGSWTEVLTYLRDNPKKRVDMGAWGRRIVEERFCLEVTAPQLIDIYRKAARK